MFTEDYLSFVSEWFGDDYPADQVYGDDMDGGDDA